MDEEGLLDELMWFHQCLLFRPQHKRASYTVDADGQRYLALLPYLQDLGRRLGTGPLAEHERVYLKYPQFVFDPCMLHGAPDTALALRVYNALIDGINDDTA